MDFQSNHTTDADDDDDDEYEYEDQTQDASQAPSEADFWYEPPEKVAGGGQASQGLITQTAFDAYFLNASKAGKTSSNVFSDLVSPLTTEEYAATIERVSAEAKQSGEVLWQDNRLREAYFSQYFFELQEGFNLLFYGYGSKRDVLNAFAKYISARKGHVVVVNGFHPDFTFKDLLNAIEQIPLLQEESITGSNSVEAQTQRIHDFFALPAEPRRDLYLTIHNIDGPAFRTAKVKSCLSLLALNPHIHIIASIDHINAHLRWTFSEIFARKGAPVHSDTPPAIPRRGFAWLWHDLTTLAPYDFELAYADPSSISGASHMRGGRARTETAGGQTSGTVTETAASHILASVTQKARKLFVLLGTKQLEIMADEGNANGTGANPPESAYDYARLFNAARDNFIATNDTALRSLLSEFKDHALVVSTSTGAAAGESLWIAMRRDALTKIIQELKRQDA